MEVEVDASHLARRGLTREQVETQLTVERDQRRDFRHPISEQAAVFRAALSKL
ncbi:MAG TPA: hypothetical protein VJO72_13730 [Candidatus Dormibacteraeota bacterium]|nr:hypothetical protein [Candidatus Dormibacteraeota bacterium]